MKLYKNKYRIDSTRLQSWNYGNAGMYFITICTANRIHYFGEIVVGAQCIAPPQLQPTELGKIAEQEWLKTPGMRPDMNLELDEFVVMPNHFHAILIIGKNQYNSGYGVDCRDAMHRVPTNGHRVPTTTNMHRIPTNGHCAPTDCVITEHYKPKPKNQFGPQRKNLASVIRGFKSAVTTYARKNSIPFNWQSRFYDSILWSVNDYRRVSQYIKNNPAQWHTDTLFR